MNATRRIVCIYIMVSLAFVINLQAQDKHAPLQKQVRIYATSLSIDSLSRLITAQTNMYLSFNANKVAAGKKIVVQKRLYTFYELLELIKTNTGSGYKVYQDHVIFHSSDKVKLKPGNRQAIDKTISKKARLPDNADGSIRNKIANSISKSGTAITKKDSESPRSNEIIKPAKQPGSKETPPSSKENNIAAALPDNQSASNVKGKDSGHTQLHDQIPPTQKLQIERLSVPQQLNIRTTLSYKPDFTSPRPNEYKPTHEIGWFRPPYVEAGLAIDDVFYGQPTITAGLPVIHAIFSWATNFQVSGFRYGLGSSIPLKNNWRIGIQVTTGKLARDVNINVDSIRGLSIKSDLHRISLLIEKRFNNRLHLKAGPVFNLLKSTYLRNGNPVTIATLGPVRNNGETYFYTVRPFYTLSNTYNMMEPTSTKTWIGFQAGLFYRLNFWK